MPRFHFNIYDGKADIDTDGSVLADWQEARVEAVRLAGQILKDDARDVAATREWRIDVMDEGGLVLFCLEVTLSPSSALGEAWEHRELGMRNVH